MTPLEPLARFASLLTATSLLSLQTGSAQTPLTIRQEASEIILEWPGGEPLLSSRDLSSWTLVPDATSPFVVPNLADTPDNFFAIELQPSGVSFPGDGVTVGSEEVRIQGVIGSAFRRSPGLTVTINGVAAEIVENASGPDFFRLDQLVLPAGNGTLSIVISNGLGDSETLQSTLAVDPIVANNVVLAGDYAYAAMGSGGLAILELSTGRRVPLPPALSSLDVNDLAIADGFLFILDTLGFSSGGRIRSLSLANPEAPTIASEFVTAPTRFFSGIAAANGRVIVSGGTEIMRVFEYDRESGAIGGQSTTGLGVIGRPDIILSPDGEQAFVSVDFSGNFQGFSLGLVALQIRERATGNPFTLTEQFRLGLSSGQLSRSSQPANFRLESALLGDAVLVAHEEGLSVVREGARSQLIDLGFRAVNVDVLGSTAFVVGTETNETVPRLAVIDFSDIANPDITENQAFPNRGQFLGVAANKDFVVIATSDAGGLLVLPVDELVQ